jgi:hypothetical protein
MDQEERMSSRRTVEKQIEMTWEKRKDKTSYDRNPEETLSDV